jgi:hypothetical protein
VEASDNGAGAWRTSSRSGATGSCVQVCAADGAVLMRHSKDPDGPVLTFTPLAWADFVAGVAVGDFDRPLEQRRDPPPVTGGGPLEANL